MTDGKGRYVDDVTGERYAEKPEHMTQLFGDRLVAKDHPRILFRGKMDSLQAQVVLAQATIAEGGKGRLVEDLGDVLCVLREMTRCEVLEEPFSCGAVLGLSHDELRERSHDPQRFFQIRQMLLPDYTMGREYALLNQLRAAIRETEASAVAAFRAGEAQGREDIVQGLNRLSSALHVMMCMWLAGAYGGMD